MKKNFMFVCIALLVAMTLIVSCDNSNKKPAEEAQPTPTKEFTVTFDPNFEGGAEPKAVKVEDGKLVAEPEKPTREGYSFVEWQLDGQKFDFKTPIKKDIILKAFWYKGVTVSNKEEFISAVSNSKNMIFTSDISVPATTWFNNTYSGTIDGNGYKLIIENPPMEVKYQGDDEYCIFYAATGTIKNLNFYTNGFKALVYWAQDELTFDNVNSYGTMNGADTNVGPYLIRPYNAAVSFVDCDNHADIIDKMGGNHYGSAFIAGFMDSYTKSISFTNCNNYGTIQFGKNAAFLIGNPTNINSEKISVNNCFNYGKIQAFNSVGGISWKNSTFDDTSTMNNYNKESGIIKKLDNSISSFSVSEDGTPNVLGGTNIQYKLQFNISYYKKGTTESAGNRNMTIEYSLIDGKLPTSIQKLDNFDADKHEKVVNDILYIYPYAYDGFSIEECVIANFPQKIVYYAVDVDPNTGFALGSYSYTF